MQLRRTMPRLYRLILVRTTGPYSSMAQGLGVNIYLGVWTQIHVALCQQACVKMKELFHNGIRSNHYVNTPGRHFLITVYIVGSRQAVINKRYN